MSQLDDESWDEFADRLRKEWVSGRAWQRYETLHDRYMKAVQNLAARRIEELMKLTEKASKASTKHEYEHEYAIRLIHAQAQTTAELVLLILAVHLTEQEESAPGGDEPREA